MSAQKNQIVDSVSPQNHEVITAKAFGDRVKAAFNERYNETAVLIKMADAYECAGSIMQELIKWGTSKKKVGGWVSMCDSEWGGKFGYKKAALLKMREFFKKTGLVEIDYRSTGRVIRDVNIKVYHYRINPAKFWEAFEAIAPRSENKTTPPKSKQPVAKSASTSASTPPVESAPPPRQKRDTSSSSESSPSKSSSSESSSIESSSSSPGPTHRPDDADDKKLESYLAEYWAKYGPPPTSLLPKLLDQAWRLGRDATMKKLASLNPKLNPWMMALTSLTNESAPAPAPSSAPPPPPTAEWFAPDAPDRDAQWVERWGWLKGEAKWLLTREQQESTELYTEWALQQMERRYSPKAPKPENPLMSPALAAIDAENERERQEQAEREHKQRLQEAWDKAQVEREATVHQPYREGSTSTYDDAWNVAYNQLEAQLDRSSFDTWLRDAWLMSVIPPLDQNGKAVLNIGVRNIHARDMLQHRLHRNVWRVVSDVIGSPVDLWFEVAPEKPKSDREEDMPLFRRLAEQQQQAVAVS